MKIIKRLIKIDFDTFENHSANAIRREVLGSFEDEPLKTHQSKIHAFLEQQDPIKPYLAWDGEIYPKFLIETELVK